MEYTEKIHEHSLSSEADVLPSGPIGDLYRLNLTDVNGHSPVFLLKFSKSMSLSLGK